MSVQLSPLPVNPLRHAQTLDPGTLVQTALAWQPPLPAAHSSISAQLNPLPVYPVLQAQVNDPVVSLHEALAWQLCEKAKHSSTFSRQIRPCQPLSQMQTKELEEGERGTPHPSELHCGRNKKSEIDERALFVRNCIRSTHPHFLSGIPGDRRMAVRGTDM
jgi:hypothetical protein